jgi:hypothetical protein
MLSGCDRDRMVKIFELAFPQEVTPLHRRCFDLSSALLSAILSVKSDDKG